MNSEPTLIVGAVIAAINVPQIAAISMPTWAHAIIAGVTVFLGALTNRQMVTPNSKIG